MLTLAILIDAIIPYYESKLLNDDIATDGGLLLKLAIPLASRHFHFHLPRSETSSHATTLPKFSPELATGESIFSRFRRRDGERSPGSLSATEVYWK